VDGGARPPQPSLRRDQLEKSIALAKQFKTDKVRCFDFWRLDDVTPYRASIDDKLREAAEKSERGGFSLFWKMNLSAIRLTVV
jgi:hypothetical protein